MRQKFLEGSRTTGVLTNIWLGFDHKGVLIWLRGSLVIFGWVLGVMTQVDQGFIRVNMLDSVISTNDAN
jgi:hypothetical protein